MSGGRPLRSNRERFYQHITTGDGCWEWKAATQGKGYGSFHPKVDGKWQSMPAHRFSYELHVGQIPDGMLVLHRCDNRVCVNPEHLFLGTHRDNMDDMVRKGRAAPKHGELDGNAKLTRERVTDIRERRARGEGPKALGSEFGVDRVTIWAICTRRLWKDVA